MKERRKERNEKLNEIKSTQLHFFLYSWKKLVKKKKLCSHAGGLLTENLRKKTYLQIFLLILSKLIQCFLRLEI